MRYTFFLRVDHLCGWSTLFIIVYIPSRSCGWKIIDFEGHLLICHVVANWTILVNKEIWTSLYRLINGQTIFKTHNFSSTTSWEHVDHIERCGSYPLSHTHGSFGKDLESFKLNVMKYKLEIQYIRVDLHY